MSYKYDVFLSYRKFYEWPSWIKNHFYDPFVHYLGEEIGREPEVFVDYDCIDEGESWSCKLAKSLSESKVIVPLWSPTYFNSIWCKAELTHMYAREKLCGFRTPEKPEGLIIPIAIHDGDRFPQEAKRIQYAKFHECANVRIAPHSRTDEKLAELIRNLVPKVARILDLAPPHDHRWKDLAFEQFIHLFECGDREQENVPSLG